MLAGTAGVFAHTFVKPKALVHATSSPVTTATESDATPMFLMTLPIRDSNSGIALETSAANATKGTVIVRAAITFTDMMPRSVADQRSLSREWSEHRSR